MPLKMLNFSLRAFIVVIAVLGGGASAFAAPLQKIEIAGNKRIEADAIREKMTLKEGSTLSRDAASQDILSIFSMGFFEDVRMDDDGGKLIVTVRERPVIAEVKFEGSDEFENKDLDEAAGIKAFNVLNLTKIRQAQVAIAKKYEEKGYYLARADYELVTDPTKPSEVVLVFKIEENEKVRIRKIFFLGNKVFSSGELKKIMMTSEGHIFSWATNGGTFREEAFGSRDLGALAYFYGNEGYIEAKIAKPRVTLSQDRRYVDIFIDVTEGKQYFLGDVKFTGDLLFTESDLRKSFGMKDGEVFSTGKLQEEVLKLTDKYGDEGYAFANVIPRTQAREGSDKVDLLFEVEKGEKVYWGKITVTGNTKTHDKVIRRELPFNEGELYNATKRKKGLEKIRRLGFFGNDVNFLTSTPSGSNNILDLEIRVSEKPTGTLNISAGWSSGSGPQFGGQVSQNNLRGLGQQLSVNLSWNKETKNFTLGFVDPHIFDSAWLAGADLYVQDNILDPYTQKVSGASIRIGRELIENLSLSGTYKLEHSVFKNAVDPAIFTTPEDEKSLISSLTATLAYDTRNNRLDPSGGEYASVASEFGGLGGRVFQKYTSTFRLYRRLGWKFVYRTNLELGLLANSLNNETVPDAERFVLGGIFSLRGYDQFTVGPVRNVNDYRSANNDNGTTRAAGTPRLDKNGTPVVIPMVIGGTHKIVYNNEIEFPLIPDADIRAVVFFDIGNSWNSLKDTSPALLADIGWGIRWYSPLGPLRFEWGYPLKRIPKSPVSPAFQFIIAPSF